MVSPCAELTQKEKENEMVIAPLLQALLPARNLAQKKKKTSIKATDEQSRVTEWLTF